MKSVLLLVLITIFSVQSVKADQFSKLKAESLLSQKSLEFIENKGQIADQNGNVNPDVLFIAEVPYGSITIQRDGISYSFVKYDKEQMNNLSHKINTDVDLDKLEVFDSEQSQIDIYRVDMKLIAANLNPKIETYEMSKDYVNYYQAHCPEGISNVRKYRTIRLIDIYPNIDFVVYSNRIGIVQYDFVIKPGANPELIKFEFLGADNIEINSKGDLQIETPFGIIEQNAPIAYQINELDKYLNSRDICFNSQCIRSKFNICIDNIISFNIDGYDISKPLIIDPPTRLWGTYFGGSHWDMIWAVAADNQTNDIYVAGMTRSTNAIATVGAFQTAFAAGSGDDGFLVKFDSNGVRQWSTYYGGSNTDVPRALAVDSDNNVFLAGWTESSNVIASTGAHQTTKGANADGFLVKFGADGIRIWGTYYGGNSTDHIWAMAIDTSNNVFIAGYTTSTNDIATASAYQSTLAGQYDGFLAKFSNDGTRIWGTYYGGTNVDYAYAVCLDAMNNVYLSGSSVSTSGISTAGAHQVNFAGGERDSYIAKFNSDGQRIWATYYGGTLTDIGNALVCDSSNNVYLAGQTTSTNGIATTGSHQSTLGAAYDAFLVKFDANGVRQWATYYGGSHNDYARAIAIDQFQYIYIAGYAWSNTGISTSGSHQYLFGGGGTDGFLSKFSGEGVRQWGTYYGGSSADEIWSIAIDGTGNILIAGETKSSGAIASPGAHQMIYGGGDWDSFLAKFDKEIPIVLSTQNITLSSGWNMVSANIIPENSAMSEVLSPIESNLVLLKNAYGQIFAPPFQTSLNQWNNSHAYQLRSRIATTLSLIGVQITPEATPIILNHIGWYWLPYYRTTNMAPATALASINSKFLQIKNIQGQVYHPPFFFTLQNLEPNNGYLIHMTAVDTLTYPANTVIKAAESFSRKIEQPSIFVRERNITGKTSVIAMDLQNVEYGDEIGVFTLGGMLVGSSVWQEGMRGVVVWGDDEFTNVKDGADEGEELIVKIWSKDKKYFGYVSQISLNDIANQTQTFKLTYETDAIHLLKGFAEYDKNAMLIISPQPASDELFIKLSETSDEPTRVKLYNKAGQLVLGVESASNGLIKLNTSSLSSGVYQILININGNTYSEKVVLVK